MKTYESLFEVNYPSEREINLILRGKQSFLRYFLEISGKRPIILYYEPSVVGTNKWIIGKIYSDINHIKNGSYVLCEDESGDEISNTIQEYYPEVKVYRSGNR